MKILYILLLTFCCYSAFYYRSATRYLRLILESNDPEVFLQRLKVLPLSIGGVSPGKYLKQNPVKILRIIALIISVVACLLPIEFHAWWGTIIVVLGGFWASIKKLNIRQIDLFIYQSKSFLIISIVIICGILIFAYS